MSKFGKAVVVVMVMVMLVMGGTAVFAQNTDGGDNPPAARLQDDGGNGQLAPGDGVNGRFEQEGKPEDGRRGPGNREAQTETLAAILGISVEELQAAHEAGIDLPELVESLGLDMDEIQAALQAARIAEIEDAVANGEMTQEEADQVLERMALRDIVGEIFNKDEMQAVTAAALGISVEELEAAHEAGTKLPELATELGVNIEDVQTAVEAAKAEALADAVADGLITQEQADALASHEGSHGGPGGKGPHGGQEGHGGPGGPSRLENGGSPAQPQGGSFNQGAAPDANA